MFTITLLIFPFSNLYFVVFNYLASTNIVSSLSLLSVIIASN